MKLISEIKGQIYIGRYANAKDATVNYYGRDVEGNKAIWTVNDFKPYFYVDRRRGGLTKDIRDLDKIECKQPYQVIKTKEMYDYHYEADIPFTRRVLMDVLKEQQYVPPHICYFDIETTRSGDIIACSCLTNYNDNEYYRAGNEEGIINGLLSFIKSNDIDILTSWSDFDIKALEKKKVELPEDVLFVDLYYLFKKVYLKPLDNFKLMTVAKLVDTEKINILPDKPEDLNPIELKIYNKRDTEILKLLDKKFNIVFYYTTLASNVGCEIPDTYNSSIIDDILILKECRKRGVALRSREYKTRESKIEGAYVEATKGHYKDLVIWDFSSLYPTIILSANISFETLDSSGEIKLSNGTRFSNKVEGVIPTIIRQLLKERAELKRLFKETGEIKYDVQQRSMKGSVINSMYGQMIYPNSRIYNPIVGEAVTYVGREIIQYLKNELIKKGFNVVLIDTDSCFIAGDRELKSEQYIDKIIGEYIKEHNLGDEFHVDMEGIWDKAFIKKKKHYILFNEPNKYIVKGMGIVRGDTSQFQKDLELMVMKDLINGIGKKDIAREVSKMTNLIETYPLDYIAFPKTIKTNKGYKVKTIGMRALEYTKKNLGTTDFDDYFKILYMRKCPPKLPPTDVLAIPSDKTKLEGFEIDFDKMTSKSLNRVKEYVTIDLSDFFQ